MSFNKFFQPAPTLRPMLNLGCLFDIPTGKYRKGKHGEHILNAGLAYLTGISGMGNSFKSTIAHFKMLRTLERYSCSTGQVYDTELSLTRDRLEQLAASMNLPSIRELEEEQGRFILVDKTDNSAGPGNKWFESYKEFVKEKRNASKEYIRPTPFVDRDGNYICCHTPTLFEIDSLSQMDFDAVLTMQEKNEVGSSGLNMEAMKSASAKSQMINQLPGLTGSSGTYVIMTAHIGEEHQLDPYAPPKKKLAFLKGGVKMKKVPENFTFLTNNCWYVVSTQVLQNQTTKAPEYPRDKEDDLKGDTDLQKVTLIQLRGKSGPTGLPIEIIVSQHEGVLVGLTEFNYIKTCDRYGIGGHDRSYYIELLPEVALQRTTIRGKIEENKKLQRALEITSEMCQMKNLWHDMEEGLLCSPKELYEDLKAKGYDWDVLLNTRGYWTFNDQEEELPFLSTMDLLKMRKGEYHPYWM